ncbi:hypothetical protein BJ508DRAFT_341885 [Ascobolus immersus RN42]|uniref:Uncharacterized protein n=1 Tax=Ascobolus immersus RN42 TaxID=1160509 RepID=A0A3N4IDZ2_ASCIM|nr:hypothetical protein BJ508DRAFT_341885 [Ascobolus immersus RN42]
MKVSISKSPSTFAVHVPSLLYFVFFATLLSQITSVITTPVIRTYSEGILAEHFDGRDGFLKEAIDRPSMINANLTCTLWASVEKADSGKTCADVQTVTSHINQLGRSADHPPYEYNGRYIQALNPALECDKPLRKGAKICIQARSSKDSNFAHRQCKARLPVILGETFDNRPATCREVWEKHLTANNAMGNTDKVAELERFNTFVRRLKCGNLMEGIDEVCVELEDRKSDE